MGLSDYIKIEHEKELTATQLNFKLCQVADINLPILATDDKKIGRIVDTNFDEETNIIYINLVFLQEPDLSAIKISVRELGELLGAHPNAMAKFRANGELYHLYQYGNATLRDKKSGEEVRFTMIRFFAGRIKMETGGWLSKIKNMFK